MKKNILIVNNGASNKIPFVVSSLLNLKEFNAIVVHNYIDKRMNIFQKFFYRLRLPIDFNEFNFRILNAVREFLPEIILIIKGNDVYTSTLKNIKILSPNAKIISWTGDNMLKSHNSSFYFINSISLYDIHFFSASYKNLINDFYQIGAKKVVFLNKAFSKNHHFPDYNKNLNFSVLFIGTYEFDRFQSLSYLAKNGIEVNVFGNNWDNVSNETNLIIHRKPLEGSLYRQAISSSQITLCFLRKINDDQQTSRSIEIPACKGFMIAERSKEHQLLFKEDKEAVFFESNKELLTKVRFYLNNTMQRDIIAERGYERVLKSDYTFERMAKIMIESIYN